MNLKTAVYEGERERNKQNNDCMPEQFVDLSAAQNVWNLGVTWEWKGEDE